MVRRRHVDVPGFNEDAVLGKRCGKPGTAEKRRQRAWVAADVHDDEDRRRAGDRQRCNEAPEGFKTTGRSPDHHDRVHDATST
jgi:hypothetical protein